MITIQQFNQITKELPNTTLIQMSNHMKDYTIEHPECANNGDLFYDGDGLHYDIDWDDRRRFTLGDFKALVSKDQLPTNCKIYSMDEDDRCDIEFEDVLIFDGVIILV